MNVKTRQHGTALIELMIAMVILAIGLLGAVGLQARSLSALSNASGRVDATIAAEKLVGLMWTDQANLASYVWDSTGGTAAPAAIGNWWTELAIGNPPAVAPLLPNVTAAITVTPMPGSTASQVSITISWKRRTGDAVDHHTIVATLAPTS